MAFVDNIGGQPIVIKDQGKGIKSINQYYEKRVAKLKKKYAKQQKQQLRQQNRLKYGKKFRQLQRKWKLKANYCLHAMSRFLVDVFINRKLSRVTVGYNPLWKQQARLGKRNTQIFVKIPFNRFIKLLEYKTAEHGIVVERIEESYTSKCSFLDNEPARKHHKYLGRRVRGLFYSAQGILINADINAAFNILILSEPQALPPRSVNGGYGGYVIYPLCWSLVHPWTP